MEMEDRLDKTGWNQGVKSTESGLLNWIICPKIGQTPGRYEHQMTQFIFSSNYSVARMNLLTFSFLNQISSHVLFARVGHVLTMFREVYSLELSHTKTPGGLRDTQKTRKTGLDIFPGVLIQLPQHPLTHSTDVSVTCTHHQVCSERPQQWS